MFEKQPSRTDSRNREWEQPARKRMRLSETDDQEDNREQDLQRPHSSNGHHHAEKDKDKDKSIHIASTARLASQAVAPFFAKHIPSQYAPLGDSVEQRGNTNNSKFCYRHRPDMLCRRQADEPTMEKLQQNLEALSQEDRQGIVQVWSLFSAAPSKHRNLMLQGVLAQCCFPQLSFLSTNVRELIRIDFMAALPSEVAFRILCFLDTTSLCKAAQVSRKWRQLADDDVVWHRMCEQHIDRKCTKCGWGLPLLERKRLRASKRLIQLRASGQGVEDVALSSLPGDQTDCSEEPPFTQSSPAQLESVANGRSSPISTRRPAPNQSSGEPERVTRPWKDVYKDRFKVGTNWKHGRSRLEILRGHTNGVMAVHMWDNILATGSYDNTIKIWDLDTGKELRTLCGHTLGVRCLQLDEHKLISGSLDKTVRIWNWRTGQLVATHTVHHEGVIGLHFDNNTLVSGSIDKTARVWNFTDKTRFVLRGHTDWVNSVRIDTPSRTVFTASDDCTVKLWDLDTRKCIRTYEGHVCQVQQVLILPAEFDAEDEEDLSHHHSDPGSPGSAHSSGSSFSGNNSRSPIVSHQDLLLSQTTSTNTQATEVNPFVDFAPDRPRPPRYMLTSALDSTIRLWEISTGRCVRTFFGHLEGVWALAADTLRIVSGAEDQMVKVWDPRTGKCERTFTGHRGPVTCIGLSDSRVVSGGEDGEVRVYSFGD